jgi:hypothetical protein
MAAAGAPNMTGPTGDATPDRKVVRGFIWLSALQGLCLLCFIAGAALLFVAFAHNGQQSLDNPGFTVPGRAGTQHDSYVPGGVLLGVGIAGSIAVITATQIYAVKHLGSRAMFALSAFRRRRAYLGGNDAA